VKKKTAWGNKVQLSFRVWHYIREAPHLFHCHPPCFSTMAITRNLWDRWIFISLALSIIWPNQ